MEPIAFSSPAGVAYYMPALARLALSAPTREYGWYGDLLFMNLSGGGPGNPLLKFCNAKQRNAVACLLQKMMEVGEHCEERLTDIKEIAQAKDLWSRT